jgi:hypothetical protein
VIRTLSKDYFQKSRVFLYPALGIKRGVTYTPIETYVSWDGVHGPGDMKLCCLYHLKNDDEFKNFEKYKLLGNKLFNDFKFVEGNKAVYIFDFSTMSSDWSNIINGKYSMISENHKKSIRAFIGPNSPHLPYIDSFLFPEKHFRLYSELMGVKEEVLREVGELCDPPNLELETLKISITDLHLITQNS